MVYEECKYGGQVNKLIAKSVKLFVATAVKVGIANSIFALFYKQTVGTELQILHGQR